MSITRYAGDSELPLEITILFHLSGYHDPGCTYGPPENCYPSEGEDEQEIIGIKIGETELPESVWKSLKPHIWDCINESEGLRDDLDILAGDLMADCGDDRDGGEFERDRDDSYNASYEY